MRLLHHVIDSSIRRRRARAHLALSIALLLGSVTRGGAQTPPNSPFARPGQPGATGPAGPAIPANAKFELNGITRLDDTAMVCITTLADKRSRWIKVGATVEGIKVLNYDAATGAVVIRQAGQDVTLGLKQPTYDPVQLAAYQPPAMTAPLPMATPALNAPVTNEEKATEARMLVSDLLEIGMIQRKAYEEAQARERAAKQNGDNSADSAAVAPSPVPPPAPAP